MGHNTGNDLNSSDILDFSDNCENLDVLMNADQDYWTDRFNNKKPTIDYALRMAGFTPAGFDFTTGGVLKNGDRNKCVFNQADQTWYSWSGDLPYNVIAGSAPGEGWKVVERNAVTVAREALRRTYLEAGLNLVDGSFETGAVITSTTDVVLHEKTGKCYSGPIGEVPKGTDPLSGSFVAMDTATLLGRMQKIAGVNYYQYGAKLDGVTDDTSAILKCHADANANGYKIIQAGGIAKINGTQQIVWKVDAEYSNGFHFLCDTIMDSLFLIAPEYTPINLTPGQVTIAEYTKFAMRIPSLAAYKNNAIFLTDTAAIDMMRVGGLPQGKRCMTVINRNGDLRYPLTTTFSSFDKCMLTPINIPLRTIDGLAIKYTGAVEKRHPIKITRNRVKVTSPRYIDASSANIPIGGFISIEFAYDVEVTAPVGDPIGADRVADSYFVNYWTSGKIKISGMSYDTGWAGTDGNYTRDVIHENCQADRLGGHFSCWDFTFNNITTSRSRCIEISGGGKLCINNIKVMANPNYSPIVPVEIRGDYGAEWDGDIEINGVTVDARAFTSLATNPSITVLSAITDSTVVGHDFGRRTQLPQSINIRDVEVLLRRDAGGGKLVLRGAVVGHIAGIANEVIYPTRIVVHGMSLLDGGAPVENAITAVVVHGLQKPAWTLQDISIDVKSCNNKDPRVYGENPAITGVNVLEISGNTNQSYKVTIADCDWARVSIATQGGGGSSITTAYNTRFAYLNGNESDFVTAFGCRFGSTRLNGKISLSIEGGVLEEYLNNDGVTYGQLGFPNNPEQNIRFARGVAIEVNSSVRGTVITKDSLQVGYFDSNYYIPFIPYRQGAQTPNGNVVPRWLGDEYLDTTVGQYQWYKATGTNISNWKQITN